MGIAKASSSDRISKVESESLNRGLHAAKAAKNDEFYTQYIDIQKEVEAYLEFDPNTFQGKVVYCNCDDPFESNFFKYFAANFNRLGLKRLITTSYDGSPIAGQLSLFPEYSQGNGNRQKPKAIAVSLDNVKDEDGDGAIGIADVELFLMRNNAARIALNATTQYQGGDFRSPDCIALLVQSDIVVTNPPFSLFREYLAQLVEYKKDFLIIGNQNAITYTEVFRLIKENSLWLGVDNGGTKWFQVKDDYEIQTASRIRIVDGIKYFSMGSIMWFTNLDHGRRHQFLPLMTMAENLKFDRNMQGKVAYEKYDNYDAIEIPTYKAIPSDYDGAMGVPITFLDKYNPDQFEILGWTRGADEFEARPTKRYVNPKQVKPDGSVSNGGKLNTGPNLVRQTKPTKTYYTADNTSGYLEQLYMRIIIRRMEA